MEMSEIVEDGEEATEGTIDSVPERKLAKDILSDVGTFSFAGLCACILAEIYDGTHCDFKTSYMKSLVSYLGLPDSVNNSMVGFLNGENPNCLETLIPVILNEVSLHGDGSLLIEDLVYFSVIDGTYDARARVLVKNVATFLRVGTDSIETFERNVVNYLTEVTSNTSEEDIEASKRKARNRKIKRRVIIGVAAVGGGVLLGLTGGLAVPLLAAGAGAIIGGAGAAAIGSVAGVAIIGSLFGVAGAGLTGFKMKKRVGEVEEFGFEDLLEGHELHITIAVSGWLSDDGPGCFREPWDSLHLSNEQYCLRYESKYLLDLGKALQYFATAALSMAAVEALKTTVLAGLLTAIAWPATLIQISGIIDNPWCVCIRRSAEIGRVLAETLLKKEHGRRPVSLIGYSLGARVIFYCLKEMLQSKGYEGIIEDVVLLGAPVPADPEEWHMLDTVVSGRIINGYSRGDWMLKFLYRTTSATVNIAGLQSVPWKNRRMLNVDLTDIVSGHLDYRNKISDILKFIGIRTRTTVWKQSAMIKKSKSSITMYSAKSNLHCAEAMVSTSKSMPNFDDSNSSPSECNSHDQLSDIPPSDD